MSTEAAAPEVATPSPAPTTPDGNPIAERQTTATAKQRAAEIFSRKMQANEAKAAPPVAEPAADAAPAPAVEPPKPAEPSESDRRLEALTRALQEKERAAYEAKQEAEKTAKRVAEYEEKIGKYKSNPVDALKDLGFAFEDVTRGLVEGKWKAPSAEQMAIDGTKSEVQQLREKLEALTGERESEKKQVEFARKSESLKGELTQHAETFPMLASFDWAPSAILREHEANPDRPIAEIAKDLEARARADVSKVFGSDGALKALLADPATKARLVSLLGTGKQSELAPKATAANTTGNSLGSIPASAAAEVGTRKTPSRAVSDRDRKARAAAVFSRR
jgi:hypothetical protein